MLRRAIGRATAVPRKSQTRLEAESVPTNKFIRGSTVALGVTAACLPLYVVRWKYGPISTTLLEGLVVATVALYLLGRREDRLLALGWLAFLLPALTLTLSRGAYFAVAVLALIAIATHRARVPLAAAVVVVTVALLQVPLVQRKFAGQFDLSDPQTTIR